MQVSTGTAQHSRYMKSIFQSGSSGNASFDQKCNDGFAQLIASMRQRMGNEKKKGIKRKEFPSEEETESERSFLPSDVVEQAPVPVDPPQTRRSNPYRSLKRKPAMIQQDVPNTNTTVPSPVEQRVPINATVSTRTVFQPDMVDLTTIQTSTHSLLNQSTTSDSPATVSIQDDSTTSQDPPPAQKFSQQRLSTHRRRKTRSPPSGAWSCTVCTFFNEKHTWNKARCEMCRTVRGMAVSTTM